MRSSEHHCLYIAGAELTFDSLSWD
jgi:hypothetical protein